jgi:hypothetical protein
MTNAELAILSLVAEAPRHGYELEQLIDSRGMRDWTEIGFSSIYYLLNKLEKQGLVASQLQTAEGKGPERKVFAATAQGRAAHQVASLAALSQPQKPPMPFLLGLASFPMLPPAQVLASVIAYRDALVQNLIDVEAKAQAPGLIPPFVTAMFNYSTHRIQAEIAWFNQFIQDLEAGNV